MEKLSVLNANIITTKLNKKPASESENLTAFPNNMPIIKTLKMLIKNVHFMFKICMESMVTMFASPIFMPKLPILIGNNISKYDKISDIDKNTTE